MFGIQLNIQYNSAIYIDFVNQRLYGQYCWRNNEQIFSKITIKSNTIEH